MKPSVSVRASMKLGVLVGAVLVELCISVRP